jgi:hypothetical protein
VIHRQFVVRVFVSSILRISFTTEYPTRKHVFKGLLDLRNIEARATIWRQIRHYINRCLYIVYFNVGVIQVLDLLIGNLYTGLQYTTIITYIPVYNAPQLLLIYRSTIHHNYYLYTGLQYTTIITYIPVYNTTIIWLKSTVAFQPSLNTVAKLYTIM